MLAFDTDAAKERLEQVPWVKHAQIMRLLPSTLQVVIEERVPFAVWQSRGQTYVVDVEGAVIAPAVREAYPNLPLVVGEGAGKNAADLFETLKPFDIVTKQMVAALRVGDRRWTLKLSSGVDVMLPDDGVADALKTLINLDRDRSLLQREIAAVDLRLADRVSVRIARQGGTDDARQRQRPSRRSDVKHQAKYLRWGQGGCGNQVSIVASARAS